MAITVEDGSGVTGADSYISVAEARAFALKRGVTLSAVDADVEVLLHKAMDYLLPLEDELKGFRVDAVQPLAWPRYDVVINDYLIDSDVIPQQLKDAQAQLAIEAVATDLQPSGDGRDVIRKKLDVLETEWAPGSGGYAQPTFRKVDGFLRPLLRHGGGGLTTGRA